MRKNDADNIHGAEDEKFLPLFSEMSSLGQEVLPDIYCYTNQIVNVVFIGNPKKSTNWVMIDTGMLRSFLRLSQVVKERFGPNNPPQAIILTHGHIDHVGAVVDFVRGWDVPVYAHEAELPFLRGKKSYPDSDGAVEGGLVAKMSPIFPNEPINLGNPVQALPEDGFVPSLPNWRWLHTPGHALGYISLFRDSDRALIAGDVFVNVKQESLYNVLTQTREINGLPRYLTTDWEAAKRSVEKVASLNPSVAVTGHGHPVSGGELKIALERLIKEFDKRAVPDAGKNVH